jgi:hypothetical protein
VNKGRETQVFTSELAKFKPLESKLQSNYEQHTSLLKDMITEFEALKKSSTTLFRSETIQMRMNNTVNEWNSDISNYFELQSGIQGNITMISDTLQLLSNLRNSAVEFINRRTNERAKFLQDIEEDMTVASKQALEMQLNRLSLTSPISAIPPTSNYPGQAAPGSYGGPPRFQQDVSSVYNNLDIQSPPLSTYQQHVYTSQGPSFQMQPPSYAPSTLPYRVNAPMNYPTQGRPDFYPTQSQNTNTPPPIPQKPNQQYSSINVQMPSQPSSLHGYGNATMGGYQDVARLPNLYQGNPQYSSNTQGLSLHQTYYPSNQHTPPQQPQYPPNTQGSLHQYQHYAAQPHYPSTTQVSQEQRTQQGNYQQTTQIPPPTNNLLD